MKEAHKKASRRKILMEQKLKNLKGEKMRMYEEYAAGTLSLDTYKQKKQECDRRISEVQEQIEQSKAEESTKSVVPGTVRAAAEQAENFLNGTRLTASMVSAFIENVFVYDGGRIVVRFKYEQSMYEKQVPEDKADEVYPLLFSTMRIDDIFVRYLMQYEILLGQVTNEHTQKEVTDYIKKVYNPANKDRQIGFQLTRRPRRKYKEDDLTYNRNLLGHGDIEKAVSEEKIRQLSRSIMDVLWFSLWNKAE